MELHILEHSLKVASIEKEGIQICTHGLIKLAFLASKTRCVITFATSNVPRCYFILCLCCSRLSVLILLLTLNQTGAGGIDGSASPLKMHLCSFVLRLLPAAALTAASCSFQAYPRCVVSLCVCVCVVHNENLSTHFTGKVRTFQVPTT